MDEQPETFWWKIWGRPRRTFAWLTILSLLGWIGSSVFINRAHRGADWNDLGSGLAIAAFFVVFIFLMMGLVLSLIPRTRLWAGWILRRWFFCLAVFLTLVALFYVEENWRGWRALDRVNRELEARGIVLDWDKFIPPAVPDNQNVFKAPQMQEWFVGRGPDKLTELLQNPKNFPIWGSARTIDSEADARAYLAWSDQLQPQFTMIRDALKRPCSRMDGDYSNMLTVPIPNFVAIRDLARTLAQRTHCYLLLHDPDKALAELTFIHDLRHFMDCRPTGKPMTLVAAMINVAVAGLYADVIGDGFRTHAWQEAQLVELQKELSEVHLMIPVAAALETEPAATTRSLQILPIHEVIHALGAQGNLLPFPRGWILQNIAHAVPFFYAGTEAFNVEQERVSPSSLNDSRKRLEKFLERRTPFKIYAALLIPNISKAAQTTTRNQNTINEAFIACALERYRIANGSYPDSLDALAPQFIEKLPHDIINGGPLKYRKTENSFVLYSVGWNETDDGGIQDIKNPENGDWVWSYSAK
ncbi:MAG TPA: hypothetical protein VH597_14200 [Verrucomicrobiae bacterium]|jgi:hypothetical protein|nr:hypothetical protein [Verrucomicrobiae bacterium]